MRSLSLLLFLFSLSVFAGYDRTLDLRALNPRPDTFEGVTFPRNKETMYRGVTEVQYDRTKAISAMLGADEPIESILFSGVKMMLMKERVPFYSAISTALILQGLDKKVEEKLSANGDRAFSLSEARKHAFQIVEESLKKKNMLDLHINYLSGKLEVFPQDMIFTTIYPDVANIYSKFIAVIDDTNSSMLDLNFWNKVHNSGFTFGTSAKWADKGEFISPVLIEAEKVTGYLEYLTQAPNYQIFRPLPPELDLMFMKVTISGETLVLVLDGAAGRGERANVIVKSRNNFFYADSQFDPSLEVPLLPKARKSSPPLIGVIKLCPQSAVCRVNADVLKNSQRTTKTLDAGFVTKLTSLQVGSLIPKVFYQDQGLVKDKVTEPYKITYPSSKELVSGFVAAGVKSKTSEGPAPLSVSSKEIKWNLGGVKLTKGQVLYFELPESHRDRKVSKISLSQRQDEKDNSTPLKGRFDASPAYTSVQLYALTEETTDRWRYWGGPVKFDAPKGSFFGDIETESKMTPKTLDWTITKGDLSDQASATKFNYGALRILGLGTDPSTIYELKLEFE